MINDKPKAAQPELPNETEMRAFLQATGIRPETIERAIKAGQNAPGVVTEKKPHPMRGKKRKAAEAAG